MEARGTMISKGVSHPQGANVPQLPPVAAAAFVLCLLTVIVGTVVVVQVRSRQRRMRLAEMVRATASIPRPTVSTVEPPLAATLAPLRGRDYGAAGSEGRFQPFEERPARAPAPGRPARRLAAHVEGMSPTATPAAAVIVADAEPALVVSLVEPVEAEPDPAVDSTLPPAEEVVSAVGAESLLPVWDEVPPIARPEADVSPDQEAATEPGLASVAPAPPVAPLGGDEVRVDEPVEGASVVPPPPLSPPVLEPQITVLPPRLSAPALPALPALMTREIALGDAARALREALPAVLTMTDGRRLRRAVAIGAATSVVAVAFAIRSRRR